MNQIHQLKDHWKNNQNDIWLASSIKLYRNFEKFRFAGKLDRDHRLQLLGIVGKRLLSSPELQDAHLLPAEQVSPLDKEYLVEQFLMTEGIHQAGEGEGFVVDQSAVFCAVINVRNHLQLHWLDFSETLESSYNRLVNLEGHIGSAVPYAFSDRFGFLTADPARCGTGLVLTAYLHLPALVRTGGFGDVAHPLNDEGIVTSGLHGDAHEFAGDVVMVSNAFTLGAKEETLLRQVRSAVMKFVVAERGLRDKLRGRENHADLRDHVSRAVGLATHSYQMETVEALDFLSLIKLGTSLGWVSGVSLEQANRAFFHCRRAHLVGKTPLEKEEEGQLRAKYVHEVALNAQVNL